MTHPHLLTSAKTPYLYKAPFPGTRGWDFQTVVSGDTIHPVTVATRPDNKGECLPYLITLSDQLLPLPGGEGKGRPHNPNRTAHCPAAPELGETDGWYDYFQTWDGLAM